MIQNINRFGRQEVKLLFELEQRRNFIFTFSDAKKILGSSLASVKNVIKRLKKKNRIILLQKGVYLFAPLKSGLGGHWTEDAFTILPYLLQNRKYYIGFATAMHYWEMSEQIPLITYVVLTKQKQNKTILNNRFVFVKKPTFGEIETIPFGQAKINISSREQTVIDALRFPKLSLGISETAKAIYVSQHKLNWKKLIELAKKEKSVVQRRLGYLLELMQFKQAKQLGKKFTSFSWLDPTKQKQEFSYSKKWGLKINLKEKDIFALIGEY